MSKIIIENLAKMNINRQKMIQEGFSGQKYDDVLRGKSSYKLDDVIKISEKFQLSLDTLVYGKKSSSSSELTEEEHKCLEVFNRLEPDDRIRFIAKMEQRYEDYSSEFSEELAPEVKKNVS